MFGNVVYKRVFVSVSDLLAYVHHCMVHVYDPRMCCMGKSIKTM